MSNAPPTLLTSTTTSPYSYLHLRLIPKSHLSHLPPDSLTTRTYLTTALTRFLGSLGAAIPIDILKVTPTDTWVRMPRDDLSAVCAAVTFADVDAEGDKLQIVRAGDWLGSLVGGIGEEGLWG